MNIPITPLLDERAAAAAFGLTVDWLRKDRQRARVLPYFKLGPRGSVRYSPERVMAALALLEHGGPKL